MADGAVFWQLGSRSNAELLAGLHGAIHTGRRALAALIAHLAEVEERRLHLLAACPSLFSYCVTRLGFSEDEACRRIDVARLARRHPALFPQLATGQITLSVAALLKPHLDAANSARLLAAVAGKTLQQAREVLAAHFPRPDVPSVLRKLPERGRAAVFDGGRAARESMPDRAINLPASTSASNASDVPASLNSRGRSFRSSKRCRSFRSSRRLRGPRRRSSSSSSSSSSSTGAAPHRESRRYRPPATSWSSRQTPS